MCIRDSHYSCQVFPGEIGYIVLIRFKYDVHAAVNIQTKLHYILDGTDRTDSKYGYVPADQNYDDDQNS